MIQRVLILYCILSLILAPSIKAEELIEIPASDQSFAHDITEEIQQETQATLPSSESLSTSPSSSLESTETTSSDEASTLEKLPSKEVLNQEEEPLTLPSPQPKPTPYPSPSPPSFTKLLSKQAHEASPSADSASESAEILIKETHEQKSTIVTDTQTTNISHSSQEAVITDITGENTLESSDSAALETGAAGAAVTVSTELNTTTLGTEFSYQVTDITTPDQSLNFSEVEKHCQNLAEVILENTSITNNAAIENNVQVSAVSGDNTISAPSANTSTGNSVAAAQISSIANTTIAGNCWLYSVINMFSPTSQHLLLPNEQQFLLPQTTPHNSTVSFTTDNVATTSAEVDLHSNSGMNTTSGTDTVQTGNSANSLESVTISNLQLYGNQWLLLKITNPQYWHGTLVDEKIPSYQDETGLYFWFSPSGQFPTGSAVSENALVNQTVSIHNTAAVTTRARLRANSGTNTSTSQEGTLTTGDATTDLELFTLLNTTIAGNNWYFVMLNLFDDFSGNISFARPDLELAPLHPVTVSPGSSIDFNVSVKNSGTAAGQSIVLTQKKPSWDGQTSGSTKSWDIASLSANSSLTIPVSISVPLSALPGTYYLEYSVTNLYDELSTSNNSISIQITVTNPAVGGTIEEDEQLTIYQPQYYYYYPFYQRTRPQVQSYQMKLPTAPSISTLQQPEEELPPEKELTIEFPGPLAGHFCKKNWELCSVAGLLLTTGPVRAWEKRKHFLYFKKASEESS